VCPNRAYGYRHEIIGQETQLEAAMDDDSLLPGWQCVTETGDSEIIRHMLENHGIDARIVRLPVRGSKASHDSVWVREGDVRHATNLVAQMTLAVENPPVTFPWRCSGCREENEPQFDICWKCGRDKP
jgi:hypothetical protein